MIGVILAEYNERTWLVGGMEHLDLLLVNQLAPDVSIEYVICQSESELHELWRENGAKEEGGMPWAIHPNIANRVKGVAPGFGVEFAPWSANFDDKAREVIRDAAAEAAKNPESPVILTAQDMTAEAKPMTGMTDLRLMLLETELTQLGIDASRFARAVRPADPARPLSRDWIEIKFTAEASAGTETN